MASEVEELLLETRSLNERISLFLSIRGFKKESERTPLKYPHSEKDFAQRVHLAVVHKPILAGFRNEFKDRFSREILSLRRSAQQAWYLEKDIPLERYYFSYLDGEFDAHDIFAYLRDLKEASEELDIILKRGMRCAT